MLAVAGGLPQSYIETVAGGESLGHMYADTWVPRTVWLAGSAMPTLKLSALLRTCCSR